MTKSIFQYMNPGIIHFMAYPAVMKGEGPIVETLEKILLDDFFTAVEITRIKDDAARGEVKKMLETSHVISAYGAQPVLMSNKLDLNALVEEERKKAVDEVKKCIEEAAYLGCKGVAVLSGPHPGKSLEKEALQKLQRSLEELCEFSRTFKLQLELETFDFDIDKKCLVGKSTIAAALAGKIRKKHSNFGLLLDLSHLPLQYEASKTAIKNCAKYITHLHIGNCVMKDKNHPAYGDMHPRFGVQGGENDVEQLRDFFDVLFKTGLLKNSTKAKPVAQPIISFEVKPMMGENNGLVIANAKRVFNQAWALL
jgi:sugar phosphate isomerase/epimerase